jgi:hypothetical protein
MPISIEQDGRASFAADLGMLAVRSAALVRSCMFAGWPLVGLNVRRSDPNVTHFRFLKKYRINGIYSKCLYIKIADIDLNSS